MKPFNALASLETEDYIEDLYLLEELEMYAISEEDQAEIWDYYDD